MIIIYQMMLPHTPAFLVWVVTHNGHSLRWDPNLAAVKNVDFFLRNCIRLYIPWSNPYKINEKNFKYVFQDTLAPTSQNCRPKCNLEWDLISKNFLLQLMVFLSVRFLAVALPYLSITRLTTDTIYKMVSRFLWDHSPRISFCCCTNSTRIWLGIFCLCLI